MARPAPIGPAAPTGRDYMRQQGPYRAPVETVFLNKAIANINIADHIDDPTNNLPTFALGFLLPWSQTRVRWNPRVGKGRSNVNSPKRCCLILGGPSLL